MGYKSEVEYGQLLLTGLTGLHGDGTTVFLLGIDNIFILLSQKLILDSSDVNPTSL